MVSKNLMELIEEFNGKFHELTDQEQELFMTLVLKSYSCNEDTYQKIAKTLDSIRLCTVQRLEEEVETARLGIYELMNYEANKELLDGVTGETLVPLLINALKSYMITPTVSNTSLTPLITRLLKGVDTKLAESEWSHGNGHAPFLKALVKDLEKITLKEAKKKAPKKDVKKKRGPGRPRKGTK